MPLSVPPQLNIADEFVSRPAERHPGRVAILEGSAVVTYSELARGVDRVAEALRRWGCTAGDRVLIALPDSLEFVVSFFGAAKLGAVAVPVNPSARASEYAHYLANAEPRFAIVHALALSEFAPAPPERPLEGTVVVGEGSGKRRALGGRKLSWEAWLPRETSPAVSFPTAAHDSAFILYTSGSGGTPKGVVHRHQDMLVTSRSFAQDTLGLNADDRAYSVSKLFFAYGLGNAMYFPLSVGATTMLFPDRPKPENVALVLSRYRPTVFFSVPTFYAALLQAAERGLMLDFSSVRVGVSAGEALPAEIFERFLERFKIEIVDGIGSTEMLHMFIACRPGQARAGTCGTIVPNYEAKIVDENGHAVLQGEMGDLWVRGESAFAEYWRKPELTARTKQGEWVLTGDRFFQDAEGFYHYCGRTDDLMKVSGMWVAPGEVENALLGHAMVADAAVVARQDAQGLTHPVAYVVLRPDAQPGEELVQALQDWVRRRLASYKCPQAIHFLQELPKTPTGKIQRFRLRERQE